MAGKCQQFHLFLAANPLGPCHFRLLRQKLSLRDLSFGVLGCGAGARRWDPVAMLYFFRPLAVRPPPCLTDNFSPFLTDRDTLVRDLRVLVAFIAPSCSVLTEENDRRLYKSWNMRWPLMMSTDHEIQRRDGIFYK
jgi:hypothetical protein